MYLLLKYLLFLFMLCLYVYAHLCAGNLLKPEEGIPRSCVQAFLSWGSNPSPLTNQQGLLTAKWSLPPLKD